MAENTSDNTKKRQKIVYILAVLVYLLFTALIFYYVGKPLIKFAGEPEKFRSFVESYGILGKFMFLGMMALQVFVAVIPGEPFEIAAGYTFGFWEGTFFCLLGILIGTVVVFAFVRIFGMKLVNVFFSQEKIKSIKFLHTDPKKDLLIFIIFLIPGTPKDLLTYFVGLTDIKFSKWLLIATVARLPSVVTSTAGGNALGIKDYSSAVIVFVITFLLAAAGFIIYRKICKSKKV